MQNFGIGLRQREINGNVCAGKHVGQRATTGPQPGQYEIVGSLDGLRERLTHPAGTGDGYSNVGDPRPPAKDTV